jgi:indole-3-glycerol phosphate synthase
MTTNFLDRILHTKRLEIEHLKHQRLTIAGTDIRPRRGFADKIQRSDRLAIVAEVKKASPSKGVIQPDFHPVTTAKTYETAGATCISVLTDRDYFMGSIKDLLAVRQEVTIPVLRKDFIIDEVQVDEAYLSGADAILLICAALSRERLRELSNYARGLELDVLVEIHSEPELSAALAADASVIGVNNRDLTTFDVHLETSERLIPMVPKNIPTLAESGIRNADDAARMAACGASGILVGESLMRAGAPDSMSAALKSLQIIKTSNIEDRLP